MDELQAIISNWHKHIAELENAIKLRNYDFFTVGIRETSKNFEELKKVLESNMRKENLTDEERKEILKALQFWTAQTNGIKEWQAEIEKEAKLVHRNSTVGRKLSNAYDVIQKSGNNLRLSR